jgi:hypothetical protein
MSKTPKAGYRVVPRIGAERLFECESCLSGRCDCECFPDALAYARRHFGGASVERGEVKLAGPGSVHDAEERAEQRAQRRREREERLRRAKMDLPRASEGALGEGQESTATSRGAA